MIHEHTKDNSVYFFILRFIYFFFHYILHHCVFRTRHSFENFRVINPNFVHWPSVNDEVIFIAKNVIMFIQNFV